jgi:hypothetical protein
MLLVKVRTREVQIRLTVRAGPVLSPCCSRILGKSLRAGKSMSRPGVEIQNQRTSRLRDSYVHNNTGTCCWVAAVARADQERSTITIQFGCRWAGVTKVEEARCNERSGDLQTRLQGTLRVQQVKAEGASGVETVTTSA